jgi:hypothetical protein
VFPNRHLRLIARWCQQRVPAHVRDQVRVEHRVRGRNVTIVERRPPFSPDLVGLEWSSRPLAQLRYTPPPPVGGRWRLYWADRHGRWHLLADIPPAATPAPLLAHIDIDTDPTEIFGGQGLVKCQLDAFVTYGGQFGSWAAEQLTGSRVAGVSATKDR